MTTQALARPSEPLEHTAELTPNQALEHLSRVSRAYNALYGAGLATPDNVPTLSFAEALHIIEVATEASRGEGDTEMHRRMRQLKPSMMRYVIGGGI